LPLLAMSSPHCLEEIAATGHWREADEWHSFATRHALQVAKDVESRSGAHAGKSFHGACSERKILRILLFKMAHSSVLYIFALIIHLAAVKIAYRLLVRQPNQ